MYLDIVRIVMLTEILKSTRTHSDSFEQKPHPRTHKHPMQTSRWFYGWLLLFAIEWEWESEFWVYFTIAPRRKTTQLSMSEHDSDVIINHSYATPRHTT